MTIHQAEGEASKIEIRGHMAPRYAEVLSADALDFIARLHRRFADQRRRLLRLRAERQRRYDGGALPDFLPETTHIRESDWTVAGIPHDLQDRRVEITGPVDRKMVINALNSGARVFMADYEDASAPSWSNMVEGQINLLDRWTGRLSFSDAVSGKSYQLDADPAVLIVRPRGWHLDESHIVVDGEPIAGALFDFGLYAYHCARHAIASGSGPYFYLPKLESHLEARLWNDVFVYTQEQLGLPIGTIKATVLIETLPAAFEMDEILHELRDHIVGLNCGRWDYIFSYIKRLRSRSDCLLPDRAEVGMDRAFLQAYALLLIKTCHRRGAFAMGGMAAQIPNRRNPEVNQRALEKVRADKEREAANGHDGTWVAHPDLVPIAAAVFDQHLTGPNQLHVTRDDVTITKADLLEPHSGASTEAGLRQNIRVGIQYIEAWLCGSGAVPLNNLMEDAATAEISRAQIWQQIRHRAQLEDGRVVTRKLVLDLVAEEMERLLGELGTEAASQRRFSEAVALFKSLATSEDFEEFLTLPAYELIS